MAHSALWSAKSSIQDDVFFNPDGAESAARMLIEIGEQKKHLGHDPSADYSRFLGMYNWSIGRDYKPAILAAPGFTITEQQGGTATYNSTLTFRNTQSGDFSRASQVNYSLSDVSATVVAFTGIQQLLGDTTPAGNYSIFISSVLSNPEAAPANGDVASQLQAIVATTELVPCRQSGKLLKIGENVQNYVAFADYVGEALTSKVEKSIGTNEYSNYKKLYNVFRRNLMCENQRRIYDEHVGQQSVECAISEEAVMASGESFVFGAANEVEFLNAANKTAAEALNPGLLSAGAQTQLAKYGAISAATSGQTVFEHKMFSNGFQTPKASHTNVKFSCPLWFHCTVDPDNGMSNMTFASFIRTVHITLALKDEIMKLTPGAAVRLKSSIIMQQQRSHAGFGEAPNTAAGAVAHLRRSTFNVLVETEAILPAFVTGSTISGGDIQFVDIASQQVYMLPTIRPIIENQSSVSIYHLPDQHDYGFITSNASLNISTNDNRWVSTGLMVLPRLDWNQSTSNIYSHRTWHLGGFSNVIKVPKSVVMDIPQGHVEGVNSLVDSAPSLATGAPATVPNQIAANLAAITGVIDAGYDGNNTHLANRYLYQSPTRKQHIQGFSNLIDQQNFVTQLGLKIQSFSIFDKADHRILSRASFLYDNDARSPRDKQFLLLPLALKPLNYHENSGGLNLSKYRDVIFELTVDQGVITSLGLLTSVTSATLTVISMALNVLVTTKRTQFRRFAN